MSAISVGDSVVGTGIPSGTVVTEVGTPSTIDAPDSDWKIWVSNAPTAGGSSVSLTFYPQMTDFDLSASTPVSSTTSALIPTMKKALGLDNWDVADIGVFNGVYYGILSQYKFQAPAGVAIYDSGLNLNVYVADYADKSMYQVNYDGDPASNAAVKTNSVWLRGLAVGPKSSAVDRKVWYLDGSGTAGARYLDSTISNVGTFTSGSNSGLAVDATTGDLYVALYSEVGKVVKVLSVVLTCSSGVTTSGTCTMGSSQNIVDGTTITSLDGAVSFTAGTGGSASTTLTITAVSSSGTVVDDTYTYAAATTDFITGLSHPSGVAVYGTGSSLVLYVSDTDNSKIKQYSSTGAFTKNVGVSAIPAFLYPTGVAVDSTNSYVYVSDTGNNLIRKISLLSDTVVTLASNADPPFSDPIGIAVDVEGFVYVADQSNNMVRVVDPATGQLTTRVGRYFDGNSGGLFSFDLSADPSTYGLTASAGLANSIQWINSGDEVLSRTSVSLSSISPVDTIDGGCRSLEAFKVSLTETTGAKPRCFVQMHAEFTNSLVYVEFLQYRYADLRISVDSTRILILNPATKVSVTHFKVTKPKTGTRQLWGVVSTTANGVVFFTSNGAYKSPDPSTGGKAVAVSALTTYNTLVTTTGTSVLDGAVIPSSNLLMLLLDQNGVQAMVTYDSSADTYITNNGPAAPTNYMLAYSYGVCDAAVTKGLVELTFSNDYSNQCQLPSTGLYYQSKNVYYTIPYSCLGIASNKLLTDCAEIAANLNSLVADTCSASITKVCKQQFDLNPPFGCVKDTTMDALNVISLSFSNTMVVSSLLAVVMAAILSMCHRNYKPSKEDLSFVNPPEADQDENSVAKGDIEMAPQTGKQPSSASSQRVEKRLEFVEKQLADALEKLSHFELVDEEEEQHDDTTAAGFSDQDDNSWVMERVGKAAPTPAPSSARVAVRNEHAPPLVAKGNTASDSSMSWDLGFMGYIIPSANPTSSAAPPPLAHAPAQARFNLPTATSELKKEGKKSKMKAGGTK